MGFRSWVKREAKKAKHDLNKAKDKIEDTAQDAGKAIDKTANKAAQESERIARDAAKKAEKLAERLADEAKGEAMSLIDDIKDLKKKAKGEIEGVLSKAKTEIESTANKAVGKVENTLAEKLPAALEKAFAEKLPDMMEEVFVEKLPDLITKQAPRLAEKIVKEGAGDAFKFAGELQKAVSGPGLRVVRSIIHTSHTELTKLTENEPELVEDLDSIGGGIRIGLVKAQFSGFYSRMGIIVGVLDRYIEHPPEFRRREIRDFLTALGPTSLQFVGSAKANIVCVGSSIMEIEGDVDGIPFRLGIRAVDEILKAAGVPE